MKLEHSLTPYTKINSKQINQMGQIQNSYKKTQAEHSDINHGNIFFNPSPRVMEIKNINEWDLIKLKSFAQQRKPYTKRKHNPQNARKYLQTM